MKILEKNCMKIETALILCAGFGKRLNPLTLETPKPLLKLNNLTMLEICINTLIKLGVKKIYLNTFFLKDKISDYIEKKNFSADISIIEELITERSKARDNKDWLKADLIRNKLDQQGIILEDTNDGTLWKSKK